MDNIKNDTYYVRKIVADLAFIKKYSENISRADFDADEVLQDSMMFRLVQISENSARLTDAFKSRYSEIPWTAIRGLRNRLVHEYGEVDKTIIYETVKNDVPRLYAQLFTLI